MTMATIEGVGVSNDNWYHQNVQQYGTSLLQTLARGAELFQHVDRDPLYQICGFFLCPGICSLVKRDLFA